MEELFTCPHNDGLSCNPNERNCAACGWDPAVGKARMERICKKLGIPAPQVTAPKKEAEIE